jgi:hypothetical protein
MGLQQWQVLTAARVFQGDRINRGWKEKLTDIGPVFRKDLDGLWFLGYGPIDMHQSTSETKVRKPPSGHKRIFDPFYRLGKYGARGRVRWGFAYFYSMVFWLLFGGE